MWFAFNLFFDDIWYNIYWCRCCRNRVVICFQFVLWRYLIQCRQIKSSTHYCCDLLSICSLTIFDTIRRCGIRPAYMLWFAFNLFFDDIWYNNAAERTWILLVVICFQFVLWRYLIQLLRTVLNTSSVVICFQFVLWRYLIQYTFKPVHQFFCCDLLSICSLTIFDTIGWMLMIYLQ